MKKLKYSPDAREKLHEIRHYIASEYGTQVAKNVLSKMMSSIRRLQQFENSGPSVESILGIPCDYRMLFTEHNYVFYRVSEDAIYIINIYNEREDFMWKLFGINTTDSASEDFWDWFNVPPKNL